MQLLTRGIPYTVPNTCPIVHIILQLMYVTKSYLQIKHLENNQHEKQLYANRVYKHTHSTDFFRSLDLNKGLEGQLGLRKLFPE